MGLEWMAAVSPALVELPVEIVTEVSGSNHASTWLAFPQKVHMISLSGAMRA
jgi:hypothetical protein